MANKTKIVHVAIEPEAYKALKGLAAERRCPISQIIRAAVWQLVMEQAVTVGTGYVQVGDKPRKEKP